MFDEYFRCLRRSAIVITPQQPFFDWLVSHDPETLIDEEIREGTVYLVPEYETNTRMENWLKKNYAELFEELLFNWYTDEDMWPQKRNFKMFKEWFS